MELKLIAVMVVAMDLVPISSGRRCLSRHPRPASGFDPSGGGGLRLSYG